MCGNKLLVLLFYAQNAARAMCKILNQLQKLVAIRWHLLTMLCNDEYLKMIVRIIYNVDTFVCIKKKFHLMIIIYFLFEFEVSFEVSWAWLGINNSVFLNSYF